MDGIIDSYETEPGKGVPIGNLTSQFFANMYLAGLDHYILEELRPGAYCRYMDDFVVWTSSMVELKTMLGHINDYASGRPGAAFDKRVHSVSENCAGVIVIEL